MSEPNLDAIKDKLRKLLNLTVDRGATEAEAMTALEMAEKIVEKYNLDMADVGGDPEAEMVSETVEGIFFNWERALVMEIAKFNYCKEVKCNGKAKVFGRRINVLATLEMMAFIKAQMYALLEKQKPLRPKGVAPVAFQNNYMTGLTFRIEKRLNEIMALREAPQTQSKAIVIVRDAEVSDYINRTLGKLRKGNMRMGQGEGFGAGMRDGAGIALGFEKKVGSELLRLTGGE